jgi:chemotaxis protein CheX
MTEAIDHKWIVASLCSATEEVFSTMLGVTPSPGQAYVQKDGAGQVDGVISLIGLAGNWVGTGSLACSAGTACDLSSRLLMGESTTVDQEVLDAVGELTNMVIGSFKNAAETVLGPMGLSIPTVISGHDFRAHSMCGREWIVVPFDVAGNHLEVKVCLARQENGSSAMNGPH